MKTMTIGEFKSHFAEVMEQMKAGIGLGNQTVNATDTL